MQVALGGDQRSVPGDLPQHMDGNTGVGHPGQAGVPQVVTAQMIFHGKTGAYQKDGSTRLSLSPGKIGTSQLGAGLKVKRRRSRAD